MICHSTCTQIVQVYVKLQRQRTPSSWSCTCRCCLQELKINQLLYNSREVQKQTTQRVTTSCKHWSKPWSRRIWVAENSGQEAAAAAVGLDGESCWLLLE
jgi:hypothetical protein